MLPYHVPTISSLPNPFGIRVSVLHEYQNHASVSGNKWWKLRDNLQRAKALGHTRIITFGGAYSNHIRATAAAAQLEGFESIGIIRGEEVSNPSLDFARAQGMTLHFISRAEYRSKTDDTFILNLERAFGPHYLIPEGGSNDAAVNACEEWGRLLATHPVDDIYLAVGTGGTLAGIARGINDSQRVIGVPVLRNTGFLEEVIQKWVGDNHRWTLLHDYHFGGYAKSTPQLLDFCTNFSQQHGFDIEPVYTGKLFFALFDLMNRKLLHEERRVLVVHTGGVQLRIKN